jgi:nucleoside recognition membrane protein YjiH
MLGSAQLRNRTATLLFGASAGLLVMGIILFPDKAFHASLDGLNIWWKFVFPALLPFLILVELLAGYGAVHGLGVLLEPLMRKWLNIPGVGGLALAMSLAAGLPAGAKTAADLRRQRLLDRSEGEQLLAVSHLCSPVFIVTVVGAGFLGNARLGIVLAAVHYAAFLPAAWAFRFPGRSAGPAARRSNGNSVPATFVSARNSAQRSISSGSSGPAAAGSPPAASRRARRDHSLFRKAAAAMADARMMDGRTFGKLLGDAVVSSVQTLMVTGGYIMMFSVVLTLLNLTPVIAGPIGAMVERAGSLAGMPSQYANNALPGLLEIHLGTYAQSQTPGSPMWSAAILGAMLAWGGLSVLFQVKSFIHGTDLRIGPYVMARLLHAACAFAMTLLLWTPLYRLSGGALPVSGAPGIIPKQSLGAAGNVLTQTVWAHGPVVGLSIMVLTLTCMIGLSLWIKKSGE